MSNPSAHICSLHQACALHRGEGLSQVLVLHALPLLPEPCMTARQQPAVCRQALLLAMMVGVPLSGWRMSKRTAWSLLSTYVVFQVSAAVRSACGPLMLPPRLSCMDFWTHYADARMPALFMSLAQTHARCCCLHRFCSSWRRRTLFSGRRSTSLSWRRLNNTGYCRPAQPSSLEEHERLPCSSMDLTAGLRTLFEATATVG